MNIKRLVLQGWMPVAIIILVLASIVWAATPHCPQGYTLSADGTKCMQYVDPTCAQGYWDGDGCKVKVTTPHTCPTGTTYNTELHKCISFSERTCPAGMSYNATSNKCESFQSPTCPAGMTYNAAHDRCESYSQPGCPSGYTYDTSTRKCRKQSIPTCPAGFQWSSANVTCTGGTPSGANPVCPSGTSLNTVFFPEMNASIKVCEKSATPTCNTGYKLMNGECVSTNRPGTYK